MEFSSHDDILHNAVDPSLPIAAPDPITIDTIPGTIDFYDTEVPLQEYLDDAGEDACVFLYKGRLMGSSKDYIKNTLSTIGNNHGEGIFYECRSISDDEFPHSNILRQKYGRVALSSPFYFNLEVLLPIFGSHIFWKISDEPVKRLIASASRSGAIAGGPIASADHCQAGTSKDVHTLLPFTYTTVASVAPAVTNAASRMNNNSIKLRNVNTSTNSTYKIIESITVSELRHEYSAKHGILGVSNLIKFILNGKILKDDYNIQKQSVILVQVVRDGILYEGETLAEWRARNPKATHIDMNGRDDITDDDCVHLEGVPEIDISECNNLTDAAFVHFKGVKTLVMNNCNQDGITDAAFQHLTGLELLSMAYCNQSTITDAAFIHLKGVKELYINACNQITDVAFENLDGLQILDMTACTGLTDAAFIHLKGIQNLIMENCNQPTITDAAFIHLKGVYFLSMNDCNQSTITDAAFTNLSGIHALYMDNCNQRTITDAAFASLRGIHSLNMGSCNQTTITDAAFRNLVGIQTLYMENCNQPTITDAAFANLTGIHTLNIDNCNQPSITDAAFENLLDIQILSMENCNQVGITGTFFQRFTRENVRINVKGCNQRTIQNYRNEFHPMPVGGRRRRVTRRRKNKQKAKSMKRKILNRKKTKRRYLRSM